MKTLVFATVLLWTLASVAFADTTSTGQAKPCTANQITLLTPAAGTYYLTASLQVTSFAGTVSMIAFNGDLDQGTSTVTSECQIASLGTSCSLSISCELDVTEAWKIQVVSNRDTLLSYNVTYNFEPITVTALTETAGLWTTVVTNRVVPATPLFSQRNDFYKISIPDYDSNTWQTLNFTISYLANQVQSVAINRGAYAAPGSCTDVTTTGTYIFDACELESIYTATPAFGGDWYVTVQLPTNAPATGSNYTLTITLSGPTFNKLTLPSSSSNNGSPFTAANQIDYFTFDPTTVPANNQVNLTVSAIEGGKITLAYGFNEPPFFTCLPASVSCTTNTTCTLVIDACFVPTSGLVYIGVLSGNLAVPTRGISYVLNVAASVLPSAATLQQGNYNPTQIGQAQYQHYKFSSKSYSVNDDTWLGVHLYSDNTIAANLALYVNFDEKAGGLNSCYENFASCEISSALGSCTVQINPCDFNDHDTWYVSVYSALGSDVYGAPTKYTIFAQLENPTELSTNYLVVPAVLNANEYDHYYISQDKLTAGSVWIVALDNLGNQPLTVYQYEGGLAGDVCSSNACYNNTASNNNPTSVTLNFCDPSVETPEEDYYISVYSRASNTNAAPYDIALIPYPYTTKATGAISEGDLYIGSINPSQTQNFSLSLDKLGEDDVELVITLTLVSDSANGLRVTLANTTYLQCSTFRSVQSGTVTRNAKTLTMVINPCAYEYSKGFFLIVDNLDTANVVNFNLEVNEQELSPVKLTNNEPEVSTVGQNQVQRFSYSPISPKKNNSLVIEVYFDSQPNVQGKLYISDQDDNCVGTPTCTDNYKCVYVVNSCELVFKTLYVYVSTTSALNAATPLRFTIRASEQSAFVPTSIGLPQPFQIYPSQKIYHTFSADQTAGNVLYIELSNTQGSSIVGRLAPGSTPSTCPCFGYTQSINVQPWTDVITPFEYCDLTSPTWTLLIQTTGNTPANQIVSYTINIYQVNNAPVALVAGVSADYSVLNGQYAYFTIPKPDASSQVNLQLTNIRGGSVTIFGDLTTPATKSCSALSRACTPGSDTCSLELTTCLNNINSFSVLGAASAAGPVYFSLQYTVGQSAVLAESIPTGLITVPRSFVNEYSYTLPAAASKFPLVQIKVNVTAGSVNFLISKDNCQTLPISNTNCNTQTCLITLPYCEIDGATTLYISATGTSTNSNYTIVASTLELANAITTYTTAVDITVPVGAYTTYGVKYTPSSTTSLDTFKASVSTTPNRGLVAYYGFSADAITPPVCNAGCTLNNCPYNVDACCITTGYYTVTLYNSGTSDITTSLTMGSTAVGSITQQTFPLAGYTAQTSATGTYQQIQFTFDEDSVSYPDLEFTSLVISASSEQSSNFYLRAEGYAGANTLGDGCFGSTLPAGCRGSTSCVTQYFPCLGNTIHNTYNFAAEAVATVGNFVLNTTYIQPTVLTINMPLTTQTLTSNVKGIYKVTVADKTIIDSFSIQITGIQGTLSAALTRNSLSGCPGATTAGSCSSATTPGSCTINSYIQSTSDTFYIVVTAGATGASFTIQAFSALVQPGVLNSGQPTVVANSAVTTSYYSFAVTAPTPETFVSLQVSGATGVTSIQWGFADQGIFGPAVSCALGTCDFYFGSCNLPAATTLIFRVNNILTAGYSIVATQSTKEPVSLGLNSFVASEVKVNAELPYVLDFGTAGVTYGQSLVINLANQCGTAIIYANGPEAIASKLCSSGSSTDTITLSSCDLITSGMPYKYITVAGVSQAFSDFDIPVRFNLTTTVTGEAKRFVILDDNTVNVNSDENALTEFVLPIDGAGITAGTTSFVYQIPATTTGNKGGISVSFDKPLDCATAPSITQCTPGNGQTTCTVSFTSCQLNQHSQAYVRFNAGSPANASFIVQRSNPFIRNWNDDGLNVVQTGSVTSSLYENYVITEIDSTPSNFQLQLTLNHTAGTNTNIRVLVSQTNLPGDCGTGFTCNAGLAGSCVVVIDGCTLVAKYPIYISVSTASASLQSYSLSIQQSVKSQNLPEKKEVCATLEAGAMTWFSFPVTQTPDNTAYLVNIFAVQTSTVSVYVNYGHIASSICSIVSQEITNEGSIELIGSEVSAGTTVFVGIKNNNNNGPNSFFIEWESEAITPAALTLNTPTTVLTTADDTTYYYSIALTQPQGSVETFYIELISSDATASVDYAFNGLPNVYATFTCNVGNCSLYQGCDNIGQVTLYLAVNVKADQTFTIMVGSNTINQVAYNPTSLVHSTGSLNDIDSYTFSVTDLGANGVLVYNLEIGSVVGGEVTVWITTAGFGREEAACVVPSSTIKSTSTGTIAETFCVTQTGVQYNINVRISKQTSACTSVSYSLSLWPVTAADVPTPLTIGTPVVVPVVYSSTTTNTDAFSFTITSPSSTNFLAVHYDVPSQFNKAITSTLTPSVTPFACSDSYTTNDFYISGCHLKSGSLYNLVATVPNAVVPGLTYSLTVSYVPATAVPTVGAAVVSTFEDSPYGFWYFNRTSLKDSALEIQLELVSGPSVTVEVYVNDCSISLEDLVPLVITCYSGVCVVPFSWSSNNFDVSSVYTIVVTGEAGSTYKLGYTSGSSNCQAPYKNTLKFCTDVDYPIWDNSTSLNHDALAVQRYQQLYNAFCPPCSCRSISTACNDTLKQYACDESFPACDSDGFQSPVCRATCTDVVTTCGKTFNDVGLSELECSHNFYLQNEKVCQTYGAEDDSSTLVMVLLIVLAVLVLLVILAALGYFVYYKVKAAKSKDYEQI
eukprot:TRINITY_DN307_c0_g1_i2.p1 TRINITY_DN307_c0_g1~~TRINITY_DN307_c0_g1_i2.p1  ORF type:complete len:2786 (-),score=1480.75 TRINITY_DN307_c0_g1_i2:351-8603(-)